jgi:hypothetical protein
MDLTTQADVQVIIFQTEATTVPVALVLHTGTFLRSIPMQVVIIAYSLGSQEINSKN